MIAYYIFDERMLLGEVSGDEVLVTRAWCLVVCDSLKEARSYRGNWGDHTAIYRAEVGNNKEIEFVEVLSVNRKMKTLEDYRKYYLKELKKLNLQ